MIELNEQNLTAYALGELDDPHRVAIEQWLARDAAAQRTVQEIRAIADELRCALAGESGLHLTDLQYAALERNLHEQVQPGGAPAPRPNWLLWGSLAASITIVCAVMASVLPRIYGYRGAAAGSGSGAGPTSQQQATGADVAVGGSSLQAIEQPMLSEDAGDDRPIGFSAVRQQPVVRLPLEALAASRQRLRALLNRGESSYPGQSSNPRESPFPLELHTDELVSAFIYHDAPSDGRPFAAAVEIGQCPWQSEHRLVRIGLASRERTSVSPLPAVVARNLRAKVELNPAAAGAYRLVGGGERQNRAGDPSLSAIELREGESYCVLIEVASPSAPSQADALKYQRWVNTGSDDLLTLTIEYVLPGSAEVQRIQLSASTHNIEAHLSKDFQFAAAVAAFGAWLHPSPGAPAVSWEQASNLATAAINGDEVLPDRAAFLEWMNKHRSAR